MASTAARSRAAPAVHHYEPPPPSPIVKRLRQMWQFAAISQFLFTFDEAFGVVGFEIDALEQDLDGSETEIIPNLFRRLLYTLTLNKNLSNDNWEEHLRKQYMLRDPERNPLGTPEEPRRWAELSLTQKVIAIHSTCEWQFQDAERFRKIVKTEEGAEAWRIDPIGWDSQDNTYWLYDDNRLWVQHAPPRPPAPEKPAGPPRPPKKGSKAARREAKLAAARRKVEGSTSGRSGESSSAKRPRDSDASASVSATEATVPRKRTRTRTAPSGVRRNAPRAAEYDPRAGMRTSRRLRALDDDGWQAVPPELLADGSAAKKEDDEMSEESELSDLSSSRRSSPAFAKKMVEADASEPHVEQVQDVQMDVDDEQEVPDADEVKEDDVQRTDATRAEETPGADDSVAVDHQQNPSDPSDSAAAKPTEQENGHTTAAGELQATDSKKADEPEWLEFEAVAVTRSEWLTMGERFAKSRDPNEKALHNLLKNEVLPKIISDLDEADRVRELETKLANRKRSSRIALKESEREERERDRVARIAMEERMAAVRHEEESRARKEREALAFEQAREARAREREERLLAREFEAMERARMEQLARSRKERDRERRKKRRDAIIANGGIPPPVDAANVNSDGEEEGDWELGCEACGQRGINLPDPSEMVCCEECGIWQHVVCWDQWRRSVGMPPIDWRSIDFYCTKCRPTLEGQPKPPFPSSTFAPLPSSREPAIQQQSNQVPDVSAAPQPDRLTSQGAPVSPFLPKLNSEVAQPGQEFQSAATAVPPSHNSLPPQHIHDSIQSQAPAQRAAIPAAASSVVPAQASAPKTNSGVTSEQSVVSPPIGTPGGHKRSPSYSRPTGPSPNGSFPIRRDITARSPLSGPHEPSAGPVPSLSLARPRPLSPSPMAAPNGGLQRTAVHSAIGSDAIAGAPRTSAITAAPHPISNGANSGSSNSVLYQRQTPTTNGAVPHASPGPGPSTGSLATSMTSENSRVPARAQLHAGASASRDGGLLFGPSSRGAFGASQTHIPESKASIAEVPSLPQSDPEFLGHPTAPSAEPGPAAPQVQLPVVPPSHPPQPPPSGPR